jgi:hypothetical protein
MERLSFKAEMKHGSEKMISQGDECGGRKEN